ncbi:MAG: RNA-binding transcriptional accessory protein [Desulfobacterales bacterium]|nr:RNA-binding transcriptional accessory protein [Desulfobacterales bacterium]
MSREPIAVVSEQLHLGESQVKAVAGLLDTGATIPFISRYRKEATGSLDEVAVTAIRDRLKLLADLAARQASILKSLDQNGHLTPVLKQQVLAAETMAQVEDIYLPYRPKRRTRASQAREKGLEPLAKAVLAQTGIDPHKEAAGFLNPEKGIDTIDAALGGARDIIAEIINEHPQARAGLRSLFSTRSDYICAVAKEMETEGSKYRDYFAYQEPAAQAPSHRILAMRRGEKEGFLNITVAPPESEAIAMLETLFVTGPGADAEQVKLAVSDSYRRLLSRSMETEIRLTTKERADNESIRVFADNLRQLLLAAPLGAKRILGLDPGFRTGCKLVCLDRQGNLEHHDTIFPHTGGKKAGEAGQTVKNLCKRFKIEAIAVGNGTAGKETESFLRSLKLNAALPVVMVNESGASIYSASETAREEFPELDLTVRGAISIARRLMDPLAELVKIDPKAIGVGQYQHDVDQGALKQALDDTVASCVNAVGVDVNRASVQLLTYVSGIGPQIARNITSFRNEHGPFQKRTELKKVPRLGPKAFQQAAGFLRIQNGAHPLDASAVHPESYAIVDKMVRNLDCPLDRLLSDSQLRKTIDIKQYVTKDTGLPTLRDILAELDKPGRDPRNEFELFAFAEGIDTLDDLQPGMRIPGIVTNVTAFGAFVDVGIHQDGLVHISQMADHFVKDPANIVKVQQAVKVTVLEVDAARARISLSMKTSPLAQNGNKERVLTRAVGKQAGGEGKRNKQPGPFNNAFAGLDALKKKGGGIH